MMRTRCIVVTVALLLLNVTNSSAFRLKAYAEGYSYDKGLIIENTYGESINAADVELYTNYNSYSWWGWYKTVSSFGTSTLKPGDLFLIAHPQAAFASDADATSEGIDFNGNDLLCIAYNGDCKEYIGTSQESGPWDAGGVTDATENHVLERNDDATATTSWSQSRPTWIVHSPDYDVASIRYGSSASQPPPSSPPPETPVPSSPPPQSPPPDSDGTLIVKAYGEGSSYDKGIVIENARSTSVDSSKIDILIGFNGGSYSTEVNGLGIGSIQRGARVLACHPDASYAADCDVTNGNILWNGNDAVCLAVDGICTDVIGVEGVDGPWSAGGVSSATKDNVLERKEGVVTATTSWSYSKSQWNVLSGGTDLSTIRDEQNQSPSPHTPPGQPASPPSPPSTTSPEGKSGDECPLLPSSPGDRRSNTSRLRLMTFNGEWLFDGSSDDPSISPWTSDSSSCPGKQDGLNKCNQEGAQKHVDRVAAVIESMNPDLAFIPESEDCDILNDLLGSMSSGNEYLPYMVEGTDTFTMQDVGIISRVDPSKQVTRSDARVSYPIDGSNCGYSGSSDSGVSKHVISEFSFGGQNVVIIGAHLKVRIVGSERKGCVCFGLKRLVNLGTQAFPTDPESCAQREAQAKVLQAQLQNALNNGKEAIVLGDFNDFSDKWSDIKDSQPTSQVLKILRDVDGDGSDEMRNVMQEVEQSERYTSHYDKDDDGTIDKSNGELSAIDHILLSSTLYEKITMVRFNQTHDSNAVSDHWPIMVELAV